MQEQDAPLISSSEVSLSPGTLFPFLGLQASQQKNRPSAGASDLIHSGSKAGGLYHPLVVKRLINEAVLNVNSA